MASPGNQPSKTAPADPATRARLLRAWPVAVVLAATVYFAILAFINAHGPAVGYAMVAAAEGAILLASAGLIVVTGWREHDLWPFGFLFAFVVLMTAVSLFNEKIFPDPLRNVGIIALFTMVGIRCSAATVDRAFWWAALAVAAGLVVEIASTPLYVSLFQPALFFQSFRGLEVQVFNDTGLFGPALGYEARFGYGIFSHRTSSLMMEQVGLANFAAVLFLYVVVRWQALPVYRRVFMIALVVVAIATNSARASTAFCLVCAAGYVVFPRLPRYGTLAVAPALLGGAFLMVALNGMTLDDTLQGRLSATVRFLIGFDAGTWAVGAVRMAYLAGDSGIASILMSSSLTGLLLIWAYTALVVPQRTPEQKRCAYGLSMFYFFNLTISGTAVFSMKVAALLWLLVGFMSVQSARAAARETSPRLRVAPA